MGACSTAACKHQTLKYNLAWVEFKGTQTGEGFEGSKVVSFVGTPPLQSKAGTGTGKGHGAEGQALGKVKCAWQW